MIFAMPMDGIASYIARYNNWCIVTLDSYNIFMHVNDVIHRFIVTCPLMAEDGHLYGHIHTWKYLLSPLTCTTSQITTRTVLPMTVDGVIYPIRNI